jgi:hypothetical protein
MQYKPLDKARNEIRVLRFLGLSSPVSTKDFIQCSIENVPLGGSPHFQSHHGYPHNQKCAMVWDVFTKCVDLRDSTLEQTTLDKATDLGLIQNHNQHSDSRYVWGDFEALSYTWGDQGDARSIFVNKIRRDVSRNLEEALRALRDLQETRLGMCYWVDSLCIDQKNVEERNEQVKRMKEIYSRARAVIVWLGQEGKDDRNAVQTMRHLCRNPYVENTLQLPRDLQLDGWPALVAFMQKPYWDRSWIIQELAMNHNSTLILCGRFKLTRRMIRLGAIYCQELLQASEDQSYQSDHYLELDAWSMASRMYRLASLNFNPNGEASLDLLLNLVRQADATDKKDKVYGILGLLDPNVSEDIIPDYSLSERQVYTDFMISIVKNSRRLEQIMFGGISTEKGWPSWVPDWRLPFGRHHIRYLRSRQASGNSPAKIQFLKKGRNGDLLACSGFQVDIVDGVAAQPSPRYYSNQSCNVSNRYSSRISEALQRTLLMDHPGANGELLLEVPWISGRDTRTSPANFHSASKWLKLSQSSYFRKFHEFREHNEKFGIGGQSFRDFFPQSGRKSVDIAMTLQCMRLALLSLDQRALMTTRTGYLGLAPKAVQQGDVVAVLLGCRCPIVLRPRCDNLFHVIGECYVHGLMDGEILSQESGENPLEREFVLC